MTFDSDALIVGAGVAGTAAAILLAQRGWRVALVEQHAYPRRKVCGECIAAGNLPLLEALGVGTEFNAKAGPALRRVGWMDAVATVAADMPAASSDAYPFGRVLGRDQLDALLLARAQSLGVVVRQPERVRAIVGDNGDFECLLESRARPSVSSTLRVPVVIDAHGSWERGPERGPAPTRRPLRTDDPWPRPDNSDLFAFKANFRNTALAPGFLPVLAFPGGYGGMVVGDGGRTTLACCIRRDVLADCRARAAGLPAGIAVEHHLRRVCAGVREALQSAEREDAWLSVGPLRPGIRLGADLGPFRVGNAAGESHPLIGEGISMAFQSSVLLAAALTRHPPATIRGARAAELHRRYASDWRRAFLPRLWLASACAQVAMRPALAAPARAALLRWPALLRGGARLAGKSAPAAVPTI